MSKFLLEENPLLVLPKLATLIGLNEAIMLQQLKYWLKSSRHERDGKKWHYDTYNNWQKQFPFWSVPAIKRISLKLEKMNLVITKQFNKLRGDMTKWYTINYDQLDKLSTECDQIAIQVKQQNSTDDALDQIRTMGGGMGSNSSDHGIKFVPCIRTKTSTKTSILTTMVISNPKGETMSDASVIAFENLVEKLISLGILESRAIEWIKKHGLDYILEKCDLLKKRGKEKIIDNEPAWLAKAIKENWKDQAIKAAPRVHDTLEETKTKFLEPGNGDPEIAKQSLDRIKHVLKAVISSNNLPNDGSIEKRLNVGP